LHRTGYGKERYHLPFFVAGWLASNESEFDGSACDFCILRDCENPETSGFRVGPGKADGRASIKLPEGARKGEEWLESCPIELLYKTPAIAEIFKLHRWCTKLHQDIRLMYPEGVPAIVPQALLALDRGFMEAENERCKKQAAELRNNNRTGH
jgi:hypothetical protein